MTRLNHACFGSERGHPVGGIDAQHMRRVCRCHPLGQLADTPLCCLRRSSHEVGDTSYASRNAIWLRHRPLPYGGDAEEMAVAGAERTVRRQCCSPLCDGPERDECQNEQTDGEDHRCRLASARCLVDGADA